MALTPEQILNKHFQTTQFRRATTSVTSTTSSTTSWPRCGR